MAILGQFSQIVLEQEFTRKYELWANLGPFSQIHALWAYLSRLKDIYVWLLLMKVYQLDYWLYTHRGFPEKPSSFM